MSLITHSIMCYSMVGLRVVDTGLEYSTKCVNFRLATVEDLSCDIKFTESDLLLMNCTVVLHT